MLRLVHRAKIKGPLYYRRGSYPTVFKKKWWSELMFFRFIGISSFFFGSFSSASSVEQITAKGAVEAIFMELWQTKQFAEFVFRY